MDWDARQTGCSQKEMKEGWEEEEDKEKERDQAHPSAGALAQALPMTAPAGSASLRHTLCRRPGSQQLHITGGTW